MPLSRLAPTLLVLAALVVGWTPAAAMGSPQEAIEAIQQAIRDGDAETALALAQEAVRNQPEQAWAQLWLGHAYRLGGDLAAALRSYLRAERREPENPEVVMAVAEVLEATGNLSQARAGYERAIEIAPDSTLPYRNAATLWIRAGDHARAAAHLAVYVEREPEDLEALFLLGLSRYLGGDLDGAVESLDRVLEREPGHVPATYTLGVALADRPDDHERALALLRKAVDAGHEEANASYLIGRILADRGEVEAALPAFERSLELSPDQIDATYRLARAYARIGRREEGAEMMERFRQLQQEFNEFEARDKQLKTAQNELTAALEAGDGETAGRILRRLLAEYPDNPRILVQAAKVWLSAGDIASARDAAVAAGQIEPENWEAAFIEGLAYHRGGDLPRAAAALQRSLRSNPVFADTWVVLGNVQLQAGNAPAAVQAYLAAIDLDAENPGYWLNLASAYAELGRGDLEAEALDTYRRLSERTPETRGVR